MVSVILGYHSGAVSASNSTAFLHKERENNCKSKPEARRLPIATAEQKDLSKDTVALFPLSFFLPPLYRRFSYARTCRTQITLAIGRFCISNFRKGISKKGKNTNGNVWETSGNNIVLHSVQPTNRIFLYFSFQYLHSASIALKNSEIQNEKLPKITS